MPRRVARNTSGVQGTGKVNYADIYRVFECVRPGCECLLKAPESDVLSAGDSFEIACPDCGHHTDGEHAMRAPRWKYCRVCEWLQPIEGFHRHRSMRSGYQLECKVCKNTRINPRLNPLRLPEQHREAADRRRVYGLFAPDAKVDLAAIYFHFGGRCFNCERALEMRECRLDHTLPRRLLWPLQRGPTVLCADCNAAKAEKWPSAFYETPAKLRALARLTGVPFETLAGEPLVNPDAVLSILADVDGFIERWIRYPDEIRRLRRMILDQQGADILERAHAIPAFLRVELWD